MGEIKCSSCGAPIDSNASECKYCGVAITIQTPNYQTSQVQQMEQQRESYSENQNQEFLYLKPYYQIEFSKIKDSNEKYKGKWNWAAFFFSWIWGFTKGLWKYSLITLGIFMLLSTINSSSSPNEQSPVPGFIMLGIAIAWGLKGNYWYYKILKH